MRHLLFTLTLPGWLLAVYGMMLVGQAAWLAFTGDRLIDAMPSMHTAVNSLLPAAVGGLTIDALRGLRLLIRRI